MVKTFTKAFIMLGIIAFFISLNISNVLGANPTFTSLSVNPNYPYSDSLINCSAIYNDADSNKGNVTITWFNDTTSYFSVTQFNKMTGEKVNEPLINIPKLDNLFQYNKFSEGNGTVFSDTKGNNTLVIRGHFITNHNVTWSGNYGKYGNGLLITNLTQALGFTASATPQFNVTEAGFYGNMTLCSWINSTLLVDDNVLLFGFAAFQVTQSATTGSLYIKRVNRTTTASISPSLQSMTNITDLGWVQICASVGSLSNEGKLVGEYNTTLYINGVPKTSAKVYGNLSSANLAISTYGAGTVSVLQADELMLYNQSFTDTEMISLYSGHPQNTNEVWNCSLSSIDSASESSLIYSINRTIWTKGNGSIVRNITIDFSTGLFNSVLGYGIQQPAYRHYLITDSQVQSNLRKLKPTYQRIWVENGDYSGAGSKDLIPFKDDETYDYTNLSEYINASLALGGKLSITLRYSNDSQWTGASWSYPLNISNWYNYCGNITKYYQDVCTNGTWEAQGNLPCNNFYEGPWEAWNEPTSEKLWSGNKNYTIQIFANCSAAIKTVNKSIRVSNGAFTDINGINTTQISEFMNGSGFDNNSFFVHVYDSDIQFQNYGYEDEAIRQLLNGTRVLYYTDINNMKRILLSYNSSILLKNQEYNIDWRDSPTSPLIRNEIGSTWLTSALYWMLMSNNITEENIFEGLSNSTNDNYGLMLDRTPYTKYPMYWVKYYFARFAPNNSLIVSTTSTDENIQVLALRKGSNTGAKILIINNLNNFTISNTNISFDSDSGLIWDILNNSYADSNTKINLSRYNQSYFGLQSGNFNLTEGQNSGLLDTNGNEITDDVNNVTYIDPSSTNTTIYLGNDLDIIVNTTLKKFNLPSCEIYNLSYISNTSTYLKIYNPSEWSCLDKVLSVNVNNLENGINYLFIDYSLFAHIYYSLGGQNSTAYQSVEAIENMGYQTTNYFGIAFLSLIFGVVLFLIYKTLLPYINLNKITGF